MGIGDSVMNWVRAIISGALLTILTVGGAQAQCGTTAPAGKFCGNDTGASALAGWKSVPAGSLSAIAGGTVLGNPTAASAVPIATPAPVLGIPGTSTGQIGLAGLTSGTAILRAQAVAGSAVILLPTAAGTLVSTSVAPLTINATTGAISLPGLAGGVLAGSGPAFTITPVLGVPTSSQGTLGFAGATSGTATITAQSTAGTPTLTLPNTSGTFAVNASTPLVLSATTGALTCPTCVTSSGGGAISGTAPISVSGAGVVSINAPYVTLTASNGGIVYSGSTNLAILAGTATARQMLQSGASTTPAWSTTTWPATTTINRILYSSSANVIGEIATANGGLLNTSSGGVPSITAAPVLGVAGTTVGSIGFQNATSGTITLQPVTGALGTVTLSLPAATDTLVGKATNDTFTNKTYNAQGTGNVFQIAGTTITGFASAANYFAGTATGVLINPSVIYQAETTTTYGTTTTFDFSTFINTAVTLTGNITTQTLSNVTAGKAGTITFIQDAGGSKTTVWNSIFKWAGGSSPTLSTAGNAIDVLSYTCRSATYCVASLLKGVQ